MEFGSEVRIATVAVPDSLKTVASFHFGEETESTIAVDVVVVIIDKCVELVKEIISQCMILHLQRLRGQHPESVTTLEIVKLQHLWVLKNEVVGIRSSANEMVHEKIAVLHPAILHFVAGGNDHFTKALFFLHQFYVGNVAIAAVDPHLLSLIAGI